jgi:DNA-binding HxlR family transcriptional regulator
MYLEIMLKKYECRFLFKKGTLEILSRLVNSEKPVRFNELLKVYVTPGTVSRRLKELLKAKMVVRAIELEDSYQTSEGILITEGKPKFGYLATEYSREAMKLVEEMEKHFKKLKRKYTE